MKRWLVFVLFLVALAQSGLAANQVVTDPGDDGGPNQLCAVLTTVQASGGGLPNPALELHDGNGALIAANDDWRSDQAAEIIATGIPPSDDLESAIVRNLASGNFTAIVRGVNNTTGVALVEAYGLN